MRSDHTKRISVVGGIVFVTVLGAGLAGVVKMNRGDGGRMRGCGRALAPYVACYPDELSDEERAAIIRSGGALPPAMRGVPGLRYFSDVTVWTGDGLQGPSQQATPAMLTYSFPTDGVLWGLEEIAPTSLNSLNTKLYNLFGVYNLDRGRELMRQGIAAWRRYTAIHYREVQDNNTPMDQSLARTPARGDIRIGGITAGTPNFIAYNAFPSSTFVGVQGGDMCINTSYFNALTLSDPANSFRKLRNVVSHEHGHGLGFIHAVPCDHTKLMEPFLTADFDMVQIDEIRGVQRNYGDRFAGNQTAATAHDFGDLVTPQKHSVLERFLSINGADGANGTNEDWFRFSLGEGDFTRVQIIATPRGGSAQLAQQDSGCSGTGGIVDATRAGDLAIELRTADGSQILQASASSPPGLSELISVNGLLPGTFTVRVYDAGPNPPENQVLQLYDLTIRVDDAPAPPKAIAGIDKTIAAFSDCYFMGALNSYASEPGFFIASYDWDLDGDGSFEVINNANPKQFYFSNGDYPVSLRVTDSGGLSATDTIIVTVFASATSLNPIVPGSGYRGQTVPVVLSGTNLKHVQASHVEVFGTGVSVIGTAVPNALGTQVTGLSFAIAPSAPVGQRSVGILNADGSYVRTNAFRVDPRPGRPVDPGAEP